MGKALMTYRDYGTPGELSTVTIPIVDLNAENIVTQTAAVDALREAMEDIMVVDGPDQRTLVAWVNDISVPTTNAFAQREIKWLVKYVDATTGAPHYLEIPCADLSLLDATLNDRIDMQDPLTLAFISAFEAVVSVDGHSVTVENITYVSRKS